MNYCSTFCSLFLGLILISQSPLSANAREHGVLGGGGELVNELCSNKSIEDNKACHSILESNPEAMKAKNYFHLAMVILKMAAKKSVEGQNFLKGLAAADKSPALTQCVDYYDGLVFRFKNYLAGFQEIESTTGDDFKQYARSTTNEIAMDQEPVIECFNGLEAKHIVNAQFTALTNEIFLHMDMAYVATEKLWEGA